MKISAPPATQDGRSDSRSHGRSRSPRACGTRGPGIALGLGALCVSLLLVAACGGGGSAGPVYQEGSFAAQMDFGVRMAQRGLWNEALFRFQRAQRMSPGDPEVLNNLAVAYEATGQYEEALSSYQQALQVSPENRELRRNYARFVEFYQSFRPAEEGEADGEAAEAAEATEATSQGRPPAGSPLVSGR